MKKLLYNQKGAALPIVMIVMVVFIVLGVSIGDIGVMETKRAARDEKRMQAYYLARSGAEATASWMLNPSNNGAGLVGKTSAATSISGSGINGTYVVQVINHSSTELLIKATGTVDGVTNVAALILNKAGGGSGTPVFDNTIYATDRLFLEGDTVVEGNVAAGNTIDLNGKALTVTGTTTCPAPATLPPPVFPADPSAASNLTYTGNNTRTMDIANDPDQMMVYKKLTMENGTLIITTGSSGNVVTLVVDELDLKNGTVKIQGDGRLHLFVKTSAIFKSDTNYNAPSPSYPEQLFVFLGTGCSAYLDANDIFNGFVYGPEATITIKGSNGFTGAIIGQNVNCGGTPNINYAGVGSSITFDMLPVFYYSRGPWVKP